MATGGLAFGAYGQSLSWGFGRVRETKISLFALMCHDRPNANRPFHNLISVSYCSISTTADAEDDAHD